MTPGENSHSRRRIGRGSTVRPQKFTATKPPEPKGSISSHNKKRTPAAELALPTASTIETKNSPMINRSHQLTPPPSNEAVLLVKRGPPPPHQ